MDMSISRECRRTRHGHDSLFVRFVPVRLLRSCLTCLFASSNKDVMHGHRQRTLELLWRVFVVCYLPRQLSPIDRLDNELELLKCNLNKYATRSIERQLINIDIAPSNMQHIRCTSLIGSLIKWAQLICAHYKFWLYDLRESFADGRAFLLIVSYYLPLLCDYTHDIKHLTTLAVCQTRDEHLQFDVELGQQDHQQNMMNVYERNVKANFRCLEECVKQFGTFSYELVRHENYVRDVPDERCTMIILAMLAHDLVVAADRTNGNSSDFRCQTIFEQLKDKYVDEPSTSDVAAQSMSADEHRLSTSDRPTHGTCTNLRVVRPLAQVTCSDRSSTLSSEQINVEQRSESPSASIVSIMDNKILDRVQVSCDDVDDEHEQTFNTARSGSTITYDQRRASISAAMATLSLDDFVRLEKTIESETTTIGEHRTANRLVEQTILSDVDTRATSQHDEVRHNNDIEHVGLLLVFVCCRLGCVR
jgi:hypothetical protein